MGNSINDIKFAQNNDKRFGFERRQFSYSACLPERRKTADRRNRIKIRFGSYRRETEHTECASHLQWRGWVWPLTSEINNTAVLLLRHFTCLDETCCILPMMGSVFEEIEFFWLPTRFNLYCYLKFPSIINIYPGNPRGVSFQNVAIQHLCTSKLEKGSDHSWLLLYYEFRVPGCGV